ncbi:hypothetical protein GH714_009359 [Hevea brasiliensis]|uniref:Reverse transcriptase Ty1/copia-type domain-containing protein n=1 Tax=Hevea brasiliensis TaxID=3981 RepID=A0A6A6KC61_HEVBR|nr:hypothetical protein GH714_009359 [Hevea brasiliensis]
MVGGNDRHSIIDICGLTGGEAGDATLHVKIENGETLLMSLYVDDLLITGNNIDLINHFKKEMQSKFEMTDLGKMTFFLGLEVHQTNQGTFICQEKYAREILKKFGMENCNSIDTPTPQNEKLSKEDGSEKIDSGIYRSVIGCLFYLTASRPDIMYPTSLLSRFMHEPSQNHFKAVKRVLRYVKGTIDLGIWFKSGMEAKLVGYADSDWGGSIDDMKSTSGFVFSIGSGVISWSSRK